MSGTASGSIGSPDPQDAAEVTIENQRHPLISVVLPIHNGAEYLAQAIESALGQDVAPLELVVVDDASTDRSPEIVRQYGEAVSYLRVEKQATMLGGTNVGLSISKGKYLCVLHQDDYFLPGKLQAHVQLMESDESIGFSYSAQWFVGPRGEPLVKLHSPLRRGDYVVDGSEELKHLAVQNFLNYCNVVMRRSAYEEAGPFEEPLWVSADWLLWLRLALRHRVGYIDDLLVCYRLHPGAQTLARTQDSRDWKGQAYTAIDGFFAAPDLPPAVRGRLGLTLASVDLTVGLLRLVHGQVRSSAASLRGIVRRIGWRSIPALIHSSVIVPRAMSRAMMMLNLKLQDRRAAWWRSVADEDRAALLRCPSCGAVAGYRTLRASYIERSPSQVRLRCLACGWRWSRQLAAASGGLE